jgi:hypothetical protein
MTIARLLPRLVPTLAIALLVLTACSGADTADSAGTGSSDAVDTSDTADTVDTGAAEGATAVPDGMVLVRTPVGSVARPEAWTDAGKKSSEGAEGTFLITDEAGRTVGQLDVIVNSVTPGTPADAVAGAIQGARFPNVPTLRHDRREQAEVPGAESAFLTESHYDTVDTGEKARSLDQVAVAEDGGYLLVRVSAAAASYDAELAQQVVDTMRLSGASS